MVPQHDDVRVFTDLLHHLELAIFVPLVLKHFLDRDDLAGLLNNGLAEWRGKEGVRA